MTQVEFHPEALREAEALELSGLAGFLDDAVSKIALHPRAWRRWTGRRGDQWEIRQ